MDIFIEQIVTAKPTKHNILSRMFIIAGIVIFSGLFLFAAIAFTGAIEVISLAAIPGVIWLGLYFFRGLTVEYEYTLTNQELDIDKIIGRRKRKRMVTLDLSNAEKFDIYGEEERFSADVTVSAHDNTYTKLWVLTVKHNSLGYVILLFNPNDEFALKLNKVLPARARNQKITGGFEK